MKEFMMIFIGESYTDLGLSPEQVQSRLQKWMAWHAKMDSAGIVKHGEALHDGAKSIKGVGKVITDGPYVESKEIVGGYYVIKAESMDHAIEEAKNYPDFDLGGGVEVREIMVFEG